MRERAASDAFLADLLTAERLRRGTHSATRALPVHDHAVLVQRSNLDGDRINEQQGTH